MHKIFIIRIGDDLAYLQEVCYNTHDERYEITKDVKPEYVFEESEIMDAYDKLYLINSI